MNASLGIFKVASELYSIRHSLIILVVSANTELIPHCTTTRLMLCCD